MIIAMLARYLTEYAAIFLLLLIVAYVLPAGIFYWLFFVRRNKSTEAMRIQERRHTSADVRREVKDSLISLLLFSFYSLLLYQAARLATPRFMQMRTGIRSGGCRLVLAWRFSSTTATSMSRIV